MCNKRCRRADASVVAVRPAICDKARRKQIGTVLVKLFMSYDPFLLHILHAVTNKHSRYFIAATSKYHRLSNTW